MKQRPLPVLGLSVLLIAALPFAAAALPTGEAPVKPPAATNRPLEGRRLVIGGNAEYPPYSFIDQAGRPAGHDPDVIEALADRLGFLPEYRLTVWSEALADLVAGRSDLLVNIVYSEERRARIDFTIPLSLEAYSVFARRGAFFRETGDLARGRIVALQGDIVVDRFLAPMGFLAATRLVAGVPEGMRLL
jgi:ABC-type amino acid transport substrate-binding protein